MNEITKLLIEYADPSYKEFHSKLVPGIENILGVRAPISKKIAKKYANTDTGDAFLKELPHKYYDENLLHGYMLGFLKNEDIKSKIEEFLPYMDNWAVVDSTASNLKNLFKNPHDVYDFVKKSLYSNKEYVVRFSIVSMLNYYLEDEYIDDVLNCVKNIHSDKFYVKMAQAWLFATALAKQYEKTVKLIEQKELDVWVHNKTITKAKESFRISKETKEYLNTLKVRCEK